MTLKVSTIETSAENTAARGGWGNPRLVQWDYGKEITVTLTDALMSLESLRFMLGGAIKKSDDKNTFYVHHTAEVVVGDDGILMPTDRFSDHKFTSIQASASHPIRVINLTKGWRTQIKDGTLTNGMNIEFKNPKLLGMTETESNSQTVTVAKKQVADKDDHLRIFWEEQVGGASEESAVEVTISPDTFPGTYRIVGDTFMRNTDGADEPFQFIINKAKIQSNVTITLEAEGDPSTFELTLNVQRSTNESGENEMMKLVRYQFGGSGSGEKQDDDGSLVDMTTITTETTEEEPNGGTTP